MADNLKNQMRPIARNLKPPPRPRIFTDTQQKPHDNFEPRVASFKTNIIALQSVKKIKISHYENGPFMFYVQMESSHNELQQLVANLQKTELHRFRSRPTSIGMAALARYDNKIYRVVIAKLPQSSSVSVNFVDYGFTASVDASNLFYIPDEFLSQSTYAMPFCLSGCRANELKVSDKEINFYFRQMTEKQSLTLRCVPSDGPTICQYCELLDDKINICNKLKQWNPYNNNIKFRPQSKLDMKAPQSVTVSYVESAHEFYVHLQQPEILKSYDATCDELYKAMITSPVYRNPTAGSCCAAFLGGEFYRGIVVGVGKNSQLQVKLVDFGIVEEINEKHVHILTEKFIDVPPFAHRACLKGFENLEVSENISTQFDIFCSDGQGRKIFKMILLDTFKDSYLVELEDASVNPPVNVNRMLLKNSRPLIETIQLENAKKRQKDGRKDVNGNEGIETAQQTRNYDRDRNTAQRGRGNHTSKGAQRNAPTNQSDASKHQQGSRTYFGKPTRHDDTPMNGGAKVPKEEASTWRSKELSPNVQSKNSKSPEVEQLKNWNEEKAKNSKGAKQKANGGDTTKASELKSGWVSTLLTVNRAFVHYDVHIEGLEKILDEMFAFYENKNSRPLLKELQFGAECASRSSDGNWYRSKIESINGNDVRVFHREYGNSETVHKSKLRKLDEVFSSVGDLVVTTYFAIKPAPDSDEKSLLNELLKKFEDGAKEFNFKVVKSFKDGWILEPVEKQSSKNVIDELVKQKKAQRISEDELLQLLEVKPLTSIEKPKEQPKKERKTPEKAKKIEKFVDKKPDESQAVKVPQKEKSPATCVKKTATDVKITAVTSPTDFYISRFDSIASFNELHCDIQIISSGAAGLEMFEERTLCLAQNPYDSCWYRAQIIDSDESDQMITVRCIDDGKTFSVDDKTLLKRMPAALERKKSFGIPCSLAIKVDRKCEEEATNLMMKLMESKLQVKFICDEQNDCKNFIELLSGDKNESVTDMLVERKHAARLEIVQAGKGYTSHINNTQSFFLQFEMDQLKLDVISQYFDENSAGFEKVDPQPGDVVAALFPDDTCWYRSKVEAVDGDGYLVKFIDYGNLCRVEKIGKIAEAAIIELPAYAKHCCLRKPKGIRRFSDEAELKFAEICANGATILDVKMVKPGEAAEVDITLNGKNIAEDLRSLCDAANDELNKTIESNDSENLLN